MLTEQQLRALAIGSAQAHMDAILTKKVEVEIRQSSVGWDATDLRMVFSAEMAVWFQTSEFEVILDDLNEPVGFVDEDKWKDCRWLPLPRDRLMELLQNTGFVPASAAIADLRRGPRQCAELVLTTDATRADAPRLLARVNPVTERVIAVLPLEFEQ